LEEFRGKVQNINIAVGPWLRYKEVTLSFEQSGTGKKVYQKQKNTNRQNRRTGLIRKINQ